MDHRQFEKVSAAILAEGGPVPSEVLARSAGIALAETERMLSGWPDLYRDDKGRVIGYGGLTIVETKYRMRFGRNITVRKALQRVPGVLEAKADLDTKTAEAKYDPDKVSPEALAKAVSSAGFAAKVRQ